MNWKLVLRAENQKIRPKSPCSEQIQVLTRNHRRTRYPWQSSAVPLAPVVEAKSSKGKEYYDLCERDVAWKKVKSGGFVLFKWSAGFSIPQRARTPLFALVLFESNVSRDYSTVRQSRPSSSQQSCKLSQDFVKSKLTSLLRKFAFLEDTSELLWIGPGPSNAQTYFDYD